MEAIFQNKFILSFEPKNSFCILCKSKRQEYAKGKKFKVLYHSKNVDKVVDDEATFLNSIEYSLNIINQVFESRKRRMHPM